MVARGLRTHHLNPTSIFRHLVLEYESCGTGAQALPAANRRPCRIRGQLEMSSFDGASSQDRTGIADLGFGSTFIHGAFQMNVKITFCITLALILGPTVSRAAQKTVCTVTINSSDEKQSFTKNLPAGDFKFVELTDFDKVTKATDRTESRWFKNACDARVQCDVLMVSAHFGGFFFGSSGYQLAIPPLEQKSCSNTCDGILKRPTEIFLFGCNTLAEKGKDARTQQQYIDVLLHDGYLPEIASQVAETRYGAVGSTFKDQMRRVFKGVPHLYGFSSVAPSGANIGPDLNRYFRSIPNYSAHLDQMAKTTETNQELAVAMQGTSMAQTTGVGTLANDAGVPYRRQICAMYDERSSIADRTAVIVKMLQSPERFIYLNSVVSFLNQNLTAIQDDPWANGELQKVSRNQPTLQELDRLKKAPTTSVTLRLDLMDLDVKLGRTTTSEFASSALAILKLLIYNLNQSNADLICSAKNAHGLKLNVTLEDFAEGSLSNAASLTALQCLQTSDERITAALLPLIKEKSVKTNGDNIRSYLLALIHVPGHADEKIAVANSILTYGPSFAPYAYGLLATADDGQAQLNDVAEMSRYDVHQASLVYHLFQTMPRQSGLAVALISSLPLLPSKQSYLEKMVAIVKTLPLDSPYWGNVAVEIQSQEPMMRAIYMGLISQGAQIPSPIVALATNLLLANDVYGAYYSAVLSRTTLNTDQVESLVDLVSANLNLANAGLARWVLSMQPKENLTKRIHSYIYGQGYRPVCEMQGELLQCRTEKIWLK